MTLTFYPPSRSDRLRAIFKARKNGKLDPKRLRFLGTLGLANLGLLMMARPGSIISIFFVIVLVVIVMRMTYIAHRMTERAIKRSRSNGQ